MQYDVKKMRTDVTSALGNEYMGCEDTERILTETLGFEMEQYDQYIDDEGVGRNKYIMCSAFRAKQYDNPIVVRIYYGDVTEEIVNVKICHY